MSYFLGKLVYFTETVALRMQHACAIRRNGYKDLKCRGWWRSKQEGVPAGMSEPQKAAPERSSSVNPSFFIYLGQSAFYSQPLLKHPS